MIYSYKIIDPYTQKVVGEGGMNFMNRRTIADAIRRQTGTVTKKGTAHVIQVYRLVWELQDRVNGSPIYRVIVTENKYAENA